MEKNQLFEDVAVFETKDVVVTVAHKRKPRGKYGNPLGVKIFIFCLLIVPLSAFALFVVYGNLGGLLLAFRKQTTTATNEFKVIFTGFENFEYFFEHFSEKGVFVTGMTMGQVLTNSFSYLFLVMFISLPISIIVSFFIYKKVPGSKLTVVLLYMPNILPASILAVYWQSIMDVNQSGALANFLNFLLDLEASEGKWITDRASLSLYIYTIYFGFGYNAILIWGAMSRIPEELVEAANLDGANLMREFFSITVPVVWPTLSMVIVLTWMVPFTVVNQPLMLDAGGQNGTTTWGLLMMNTVKKNQYSAAAYSIMAACISLPTTLLLRKLLEKVYPVVEV